MPFRLKRVYEAPAASDGMRVLIDRLWPRGLTKEAAKIELWAKALSPSSALRLWFNHDPERWAQFQTRYATEIKDETELLDLLRREAKRRPVTLLYASRETQFNNAVALKKMLER
jgi:uncharacterized protein YeaO (DUF488 family)